MAQTLTDEECGRLFMSHFLNQQSPNIGNVLMLNTMYSRLHNLGQREEDINRGKAYAKQRGWATDEGTMYRLTEAGHSIVHSC